LTLRKRRMEEGGKKKHGDWKKKLDLCWRRKIRTKKYISAKRRQGSSCLQASTRSLKFFFEILHYCWPTLKRRKQIELGSFRSRKMLQNDESIKVIHKVTLSFTLHPIFRWYLQNKEILLNLSMKCWSSAVNSQGSSVTIVVVRVGAVKIYVAVVEALMKSVGVHLQV
jgi:hypothetical protein